MYRSPNKILQKKTGFAWNPQPLRHSVQRVFFLCNSLFVLLTLQTICQSWTWLYLYIQGFIFKCISLHDCRAYSSSSLRAIIANNHLLFLKIFSNFVYFCPKFQIFCLISCLFNIFLPFLFPFSEKLHACPYFPK